MLMNSGEYLAIVEQLKREIKKTQYQASVHVNTEMILLYHSIGTVINEHKTRGNKFIENLATDEDQYLHHYWEPDEAQPNLLERGRGQQPCGPACPALYRPSAACPVGSDGSRSPLQPVYSDGAADCNRCQQADQGCLYPAASTVC